MKAVIRGHISYEAAERKKSKKRLTEIDNHKANLEPDYRTKQTTKLLKITALRYEYNSIVSQKCCKNAGTSQAEIL